MPWNDALIPIAKNYLAVERAVYECAYAGCETIWIIGNRETTPILRHRIGDWVNDPTINPLTLQGLNLPYQRYKQIPIYYVPIHPKDKDIRMSQAHSILYGYRRIKQIMGSFSRWSTPGKYYVCFPHGVFTPNILQKHRPLISSKQSIFLQSPQGQTIKDGVPLSFTFDSNEYWALRRAFLDNESLLWNGTWNHDRWKFEGNHLKYEDQYTGRFIKVETLVQNITIPPESIIPLKWFYDISSWDKYCEFLASKWAKTTRRPNGFLKYHEFSKVGVDLEEENLDDES